MKGVKTARVVLSVGRKRHINKLRVDFVQCFNINLQALCNARAIVFHQYICAFDHLVEALENFGVFQVERNAFLVSVQCVMVVAFALHLRLFAANKVASLGVLHLNNACSQIPKKETCVCAKQIAREIEYDDVFKWLLHEVLLSGF